MPKELPAFKLKNTSLPFFVLHAMTCDMEQFKLQLQEYLSQVPDFFAAAPVVLGLAGIAEANDSADLADLVPFMRQRGISIAGVLGGSVSQRKAALDYGLALFPDPPAPRQPAHCAASSEPLSGEGLPPLTTPADGVPELVAPPTFVEEVIGVPTRRPSLVIDKPVRTGQRIYAEGGDLVVLAIVNAGAELIADGHIHVYAPLRGRVLAGARGDQSARIFAQCMEAELVSIAGYFLVLEDGVPAALHGKPVQVSLEGERVVLNPMPLLR